MRAVVLSGLVLLLAACASRHAGEPAAADEASTAAPTAAASQDAAGLELPASFAGTLPCADCEGIRHHLDLWPDGVFHLRRTWLGTQGVDYQLGRWQPLSGRAAIGLHSLAETPLSFEVVGTRRLRLLDQAGEPIVSDLPYELTSEGGLSPVAMSLTVHGMFTYMADAARFEECMTGRSYPVAMMGDYLNLEQAYLGVRKSAPGAPVMAYFEADIEPRPAMEGDALIPTVSVRRFVGLFPDQSCERSMSTASLQNTYWRFVAFAGKPVSAVEGHREPYLLVRTDRAQYAASAGCNQISGAYDVVGDRIELRPGPMTRMACPPPLDVLEQTLVAALGAARGWRIHAQVLELFDAEGVSIATLEAVYLP